MFEWTSNWLERMKGETHLYIADNAEHSYATGIFGAIRDLANFCNSVFLGGKRPEFSYGLDREQGLITVQIPEHQPHGRVVLRHAHTISRTGLRDFRFIGGAVQGKDGKFSCSFPSFLIKGDKCFQPIVWLGTTLTETLPGLYTGTIPRPIAGYTGAYVEVYFPPDTGLRQEYQMTTPGMVWPQKLPYEDCRGDQCVGRLL